MAMPKRTWKYYPNQQSLFDSLSLPTDPLEEALRVFPKIDLHAHLSGCLRASTVLELIQENNLNIPKSVMGNPLGSIVFHKPAKSYTSSFQPWKQVLNRIMEIPGVLPRLISEVAEDFAKDNVIYSELRVSPRLPFQNGYLEKFLETLHEAVVNAQKAFNIDAPVKSQAARKRETRVGSCTETPVLPATG